MKKLEYGAPQIYIFEIDSSGDAVKQVDVKIQSINDNLFTFDKNITITDVGQPIVIHQKNANNYGFGILKNSNVLEMDYSYFGDFDVGMDVVVYSGVGMALFEGLEINANSSGIGYKGKNAVDKEWIETDVDINVVVKNALYSSEFLKFVNNFQNSQFGQGISFLMSDLDITNGKQVKPRDVAVLAIRKLKENDGWEEVFINRVNMATTTIPNLRDSFSSYDVDFNAMLKSLTEEDCISYSIQKSYIDWFWEDSVNFKWEGNVDWIWGIGYELKDN
jgi:hypothetical protein